LTDEDELLINIGTGSQISVISQNIINEENIETRPYFDNKYLVVGAALCGGRAYSVLKEFYKSVVSHFTIIDDDQVYKIMDEFLKSDIENIDKINVDTRFAGTRVDPKLRGSISNISVENFTPSILTYGVLMGMLQELNSLYSSMGVNSTGIVGSGNGLRKNPVLRNIFSELFGAEVVLSQYEEEAACGAALI
jgi:sedoheptulokinase